MVRPMHTVILNVGHRLFFHELLSGPGDAIYQVDVAGDCEANRAEKATVGGPTEIQMSN